MASPVTRFAEAADAAVAAPLLHKGEAAIRALSALGEVVADFDARLTRAAADRAALEARLAALEQLGRPPPAA